MAPFCLLFFFYFFLLFFSFLTHSATSKKRRPFKGKCTSYRKFEFLHNRIAVPYTIFSGFHQQIFSETDNRIFEVKYLDKY